MNRAVFPLLAATLCSCAPQSNSIAPEEVFLSDGLVYIYSDYCDECNALNQFVPEHVNRLSIDVYRVYDYFAYESNASRAKELSLGATSIGDVYFAYSPTILEIDGGAVSDYAAGYADCLALLEKGAAA